MTTTNQPPPRNYNQGDTLIIFAPFPNQPAPRVTPADKQAIQQNGVWGKRRPVVVVSTAHNKRGEDLLVALLTTQVEKARVRGEYILQRWQEAGLNAESALRPRLFQIVKDESYTLRAPYIRMTVKASRIC